MDMAEISGIHENRQSKIFAGKKNATHNEEKREEWGGHTSMKERNFEISSPV